MAFVPVQLKHDNEIQSLNEKLKSLDIEYLNIDGILKIDDSPYLIVGKEKSGKSTLLNKIAEEYKIKTYYFSTNQENINKYNKYSNIVVKELNFENLNNIWNDIKKSEKTNDKIILLIDNIDEAMMKIKSDDIKIKCEIDKENEISIKKAFDMLLLDIFAKARRYHTLLCMCVKMWQTIDVKHLLKNFIIMDEHSALELKHMPSVGNIETKNKINEIFKSLNNYPFNPVIIKDNKIFITN